MALPTPAKPSPQPSSGGYIAALLLAISVVVIAYLLWTAPTETGPLDATASSAAALLPPPPPPHRCGPAPSAGSRIGEAHVKGDEEAMEAAPYSTEVGQALPLSGGFAVGVKRYVAGAAAAEVRLLGPEGASRSSIALGPLRGDGDAPLVVALPGGQWLAGLLEPNAGGWSLRLAWSRQGEVHWGAEIDQGQDESLAFDIAYGERVGVAAWDDIDERAELSVVALLRLDRNDHQRVGKRQVVSRRVDAEMPRLVTRAGGFWLAYLGHEPPQPDADKGQGGDARFPAEQIRHAWIELLPLDLDGAPQGAPTVVTATDGYVQSFDLALAANGEDAVLAWREDDTPSGAEGGKVLLMHVSPGAAVHTQVVADEDVGMGTPQLLPGWLAVFNVRGRVRLAPLNGAGQLAGPLLLEPSLGRVQPIGASGDGLLLARPYGRAMDVLLAHCDHTRYLGAEVGSDAAAAATAAP